MRQVAILSGKGGTGKTSLTAALARQSAAPLVLCDCDVDAANLALTLPGETILDEPFFAGQKAVVDEDACTGCAQCAAVCRFGAMSLPGGIAAVNALHCEGCRACGLVCDDKAIKFEPHRAGRLFAQKTASGVLVHAALGIAEGNSGKLVATVRERARRYAEQNAYDLVLIDGPPGIGCPVHATLSGVDFIVAVTEPSPSGSADLIRLLDLAEHFHINVFVVVNKYDLCLPMTAQIERTAASRHARPIGRIAFDDAVPKRLKASSPLGIPSFDRAVQTIWQSIRRAL